MIKPRPGMTIEQSREYNRTKAAEQRTRDPNYYKRWRKAHPERNRSRYRKYRYGLSYQEFVAMYHKQKGLCACCGTKLKLDLPKHDLKLSPCVDHNHKTGKVRSLLCNDCNAGIGCFKESVKRLMAAIRYLNFHRKKKK